MTPFRLVQHATLGLIFTCGVGLSAVAEDKMMPMDHGEHEMDHSEHRKMMSGSMQGAEVSGADVRLSDAELLDQDGQLVRLSSDVVGDRVVVVDFIFTTCTTICPVTTSLLVRAREVLTDISDEDLRFISVSIDPNTDTPERLKAFSDRLRADWTFLTGDKQVVDQVLLDLDAYSTNPEDHAPMILIGDGSTGKFIRVFGLPDPAFVERTVNEFLEARDDVEATHAKHEH